MRNQSIFPFLIVPRVFNTAIFALILRKWFSIVILRDAQVQMRIKYLIVLQPALIYLWIVKPGKHGFCSLKWLWVPKFYLLQNNNAGFWVHYLRSRYWRNNKEKKMAGSFVRFHYHPLSVGKISTLISQFTHKWISNI